MVDMTKVVHRDVCKLSLKKVLLFVFIPGGAVFVVQLLSIDQTRVYTELLIV